MNDDGNRIEFNGRVITGWMATLILLLCLAGLVGTSVYAGWQAGVRHVCAPAATAGE